MYLLNIFITFLFSLINIGGAIITGKIPKGSLWQIIQGNIEFLSTDYWHNEDVAYMWKSTNAKLRELNHLRLQQDINTLIDSRDELNKLSETARINFSNNIHDLVLRNNRKIL